MSRSRAFGLVVTVASLATALSSVGAASAQGPGAPTAPPPGYVAPPPPVDVAAGNPEETYKHFTLQANPLSAGIGRYGVDVAYLPALHHGLVLNPFYQHVGAEVDINGVKSSTTFSGFGGEVGYRFYTGERGANGFYVGPSVIFGSYSQSNSGGDKVSFTSVGGALDIGGQAIIGGGFTIGGGFGLQYTKTSTSFENLPFAAAVLAGGGVRPRILFTIGYSFG